VVAVSANFWKGLSAEDKAAFAAAAVEGASYFDDLIVADEDASMAKAKAEGGKVVQPEDRPGWEAGARKVWASFAPKLGGLEKIEAIASST
jgi:TRAP-type C4-dicarboxylate transport system substrate-binding protein